MRDCDGVLYSVLDWSAKGGRAGRANKALLFTHAWYVLALWKSTRSLELPPGLFP